MSSIWQTKNHQVIYRVSFLFDKLGVPQNSQNGMVESTLVVMRIAPRTVRISPPLSYGISTVTLKNRWAAFVEHSQSAPSVRFVLSQAATILYRSLPLKVILPSRTIFPFGVIHTSCHAAPRSSFG